MELFHLKTPYLDCPQCFFYNSRALSGTPYIGIAKQEPEGAEPLMDVTANLSDEVPLGCIAVKDYSENTGLLAFLKSIGFITISPARSASHPALRSRWLPDSSNSWIFGI